MNQEVRIASIGNVDSAKTTTISCVSNNILDDGKGYARCKIMKHPHEYITGKTSSITYNYVKNNGKIYTFVDLAGHSKYLKTTIAGLAGGFVDYAMLTIGGDRGIMGTTKEHICLALSLKIPMFIVITKIDISLEEKLNKITDRITGIMKGKQAGNKKVVIVTDKVDRDLIHDFKKNKICPLFLISNKSGKNIDKLSEFIFSLTSNYSWISKGDEKLFMIEDNYNVKGIGLVVTGTVKRGVIKINDKLSIGPIDGKYSEIIVKSIHDNFRQSTNTLTAGISGCLNIKWLKKKDILMRNNIKRGLVIVNKTTCIKKFQAKITIFHHPTTIKVSYEPVIQCGTVRQTAKITHMNKHLLRSGDSAVVDFEFMFHPEFIELHSEIIFREGNTKGVGKVIKIYKD